MTRRVRTHTEEQSPQEQTLGRITFTRQMYEKETTNEISKKQSHGHYAGKRHRSEIDTSFQLTTAHYSHSTVWGRAKRGAWGRRKDSTISAGNTHTAYNRGQRASLLDCSNKDSVETRHRAPP